MIYPCDVEYEQICIKGAILNAAESCCGTIAQNKLHGENIRDGGKKKQVIGLV